MKFARFSDKDKESYGIIKNDIVQRICGNFPFEYQITDECCQLSEIKLLAPCRPSKIIAVGLNYKDHIMEFSGRSIPEEPVIFIKLPHSVIGPEDEIIIPEGATRVDYEAELAVVIKKYCFRVPEQESYQYILGATCLNDVTERDLQKKDGQWTRAKNFSTFCPIGPWITDEIDYDNCGIEMRLNGQTRQKSNTSNLIWSVGQLISFISKVIPLYPGDVVTTGTPSGVDPVKPGDITEVIIEGIGILRNKVASGSGT